MNGDLVVPPDIARAMLEHARSELPNEACGLLAGDARSGQVRRYHPALKAEASPYAFEVAPEDLVRIILDIERDGDDLVAIFHSHPRSAAEPSQRDIRSAAYPVVHVLASLADPSATSPAGCLRAWRITDGASREVALGLG